MKTLQEKKIEKQSELIEISAKLIGEIIDNYEADAINLPAELYNDLKFHWKQLVKQPKALDKEIEQPTDGDYDVHVPLKPKKTLKGKLIMDGAQRKRASWNDVKEKYLEFHKIDYLLRIWLLILISDIGFYLSSHSRER